MTPKSMKSKPRGHSEEFASSDKRIVVTSWKDNNVAMMASNFIGVGDTFEVRRWDKEARQHVLIKQPQVIAKYNKSMGGVDKLDFLLSIYWTSIR